MKSPKPPDPYKTAAAQEGSERTAAATSSIYNNPNIYTPYGSQTYSIGGYETITDSRGKKVQVPRYNQTQTLSPDQQRLLDYQNQMGFNMGQAGVEQSAKLREHLNKSIDPSQWQAWNAGPGMENLRQDEGPTDRRAIEDAMMKNYTEDTKGQQQSQDVQMSMRGLNPGSSQYGGIQKVRGDERARAGRESYLASGNEARQAQDAYNRVGEQRFNMGGQIADRANALRGMQSGEAFALRNQPINEIMALMGGSQVSMPQFSPYQGQGVNAANIGQYIGNNYAQQNAAASNFNQGLFNVAGAGLGAWMGA